MYGGWRRRTEREEKKKKIKTTHSHTHARTSIQTRVFEWWPPNGRFTGLDVPVDNKQMGFGHAAARLKKKKKLTPTRKSGARRRRRRRTAVTRRREKRTETVPSPRPLDAVRSTAQGGPPAEI